MRAIDADVFDKCLENAEAEAIHMRKHVFASAVNVIRGNLKAFPTIEPKRKQGHWIEIEGYDGVEGYQCSVCNALWTFPEGTPEENEANYCPDCGADMRGGKQE